MHSKIYSGRTITDYSVILIFPYFYQIQQFYSSVLFFSYLWFFFYHFNFLYYILETAKLIQVHKQIKLIIREMYIKTTMRYYLIQLKIGHYQKEKYNKCLWRWGEKGNSAHRWWDCKLAQPLWGKVWRFLKAVYKELPYDPASPFLGINPREVKSVCQRDIDRKSVV